MAKEKDYKKPSIGAAIVFHDPSGVAHNALVSCVHNDYLINLIFISGDANKQDTYGRQFERATSTTHKSQSQVHGMYWRYADETPNPYIPPIDT